MPVNSMLPKSCSVMGSFGMQIVCSLGLWLAYFTSPGALESMSTQHSLSVSAHGSGFPSALQGHTSHLVLVRHVDWGLLGLAAVTVFHLVASAEAERSVGAAGQRAGRDHCTQTQCHYVEPHVLSPPCFSTDLLGGWPVCDAAASSRRTPCHGRPPR